MIEGFKIFGVQSFGVRLKGLVSLGVVLSFISRSEPKALAEAVQKCLGSGVKAQLQLGS